MKLKNLIAVSCIPFALIFACGGNASNSSSGDGDGNATGDGDTTGDGDGDGSITSVDDGGSSSGGKDDACADFCEQISTCEGVEAADCVNNCVESTTTSLAGQEVINNCFSEDLCTAEEADGVVALLCLVTELDSIELSEEAETYCSDSVDTINECLGSEPDPEAQIGNCEDTVGVASDELLAALNDCAAKDCEDVQACVELEALTAALPLVGAISAIENGEQPSPAVLAELVALGVVFGQLGLEDQGGLFPTDPIGMGGAAGR